MEQQNQYLNLIKPLWAPPSWVFGPVWSVLYLIIAFSFGCIFYKAFKGEVRFIVVLPFILNIVFNLAYTPIQFGMQNYVLASADIILVLATLVWAIFSAIKLTDYSWVGYVNIPYLLWVSFATVLQLTITWMNR